MLTGDIADEVDTSDTMSLYKCPHPYLATVIKTREWKPNELKLNVGRWKLEKKSTSSEFMDWYL